MEKFSRIDKIKAFINKYNENREQNRLKINIVSVFLLAVFIVCCIVALAFKDKYYVCYFISMLSFFVLMLISLLNKDFFNTLRLFAVCGMILSVSIAVFILSIINAYSVNCVLQYFIFCTVTGVCWTILSLIADNKIATLTNEIYSIIFSVIMIIKDSVIDILQYFNLTMPRDLNIFLDAIFTPLLVINASATLACLIYKFNSENKK